MEQRFQELQVVASFLRLVLDIHCEVGETLGICTIDPLQEPNNLLQLGFLQLLVNVLKVFSASSPVVNFVQRPRIFILVLRIGIVDDFTNLLVPVDDGAL